MLPKFDHKKRKGRALIVEGGGMRGAFTGGALGGMSEVYPVHNFDLVVGVSSGSCAAAYYVTETGNHHKSSMVKFLMVWRHELSGSKLINIRNILKGKSPLDQEYLVDELFGEKYKIQKERLFEKDRTPFYIAVSNLETNKSEYIKATGTNLLPLLKAATSLPIATRGKRKIGDRVYTDGGVLDPLPVQTVIEAGYTDITVVITNPRAFRESQISKLVSKMCFPRFPKMAKLLHEKQHIRHRHAYDLICNPPKNIKFTIIDPPGKLPITMIGSNILHLNDSVDIGIRRAYETYGFKHTQRGFFDNFKKYIPFFSKQSFS